MDAFVDFLSESLVWTGIFVGIAAVIFLAMLRVATVKEGFYVAFKKQGGFVYGAMEFKGFHLEPDGTIVAGPGDDHHGSCDLIWRWGGWVFYLWPFVAPAKYSDYNDPADGFGEGIYVRLGDVASNPYTAEAETTEPAIGADEKPGSVAVSVKFTSKMRVVHPQRFLFRSPRNVIKEAVEDRQDGVLRALIFSGSVADIQSAKGNGKALWTKLGPGKLDLLGAFDEARNEWGLDIVENSIVVKQVDVDPEYQKALKAKSQQTLLADGEAARIYGPIKKGVDNYKLQQKDAVELQKRALAGGGTIKESQFKVGNLDGTSLLPGAISEIVSGVAAIFGAKDAAKDDSGKTDSDKGGGKKKRAKPVADKDPLAEDDDDEEDEEEKK